MKQFLPSAGFLFRRFSQVLGKFRTPAALSIVFVSMIFSGCFRHFYSTNTASHIDSATLIKLISAQKYFIMHDLSQNKVFALYNVKVNNEELVAQPGLVLSEHTNYEHPATRDHNVFPVKDKEIVLYEVHFYSQYPVKDSSQVSIPLKNFSRIDVYELDKKSTDKAKVASIVGITLTTAAVVGIIVAVSESNQNTSQPAPTTTTTGSGDYACSPQVYLTDHNQAELQGTLYSGAIYASLQRTDYLPLTLAQPSGDKVRITVKGNEKEEIMLNSVQLMQVTHKEKEHVLIDRKGEVLVYHDPVMPGPALRGNKQDICPEIMACDGKYYSFTNHTKGELSSDIMLSFNKPRGATSGKLIVNAKNSPWAYYLFNQFKSLYGEDYPDMIRKKDKAAPAQVMRCELDQYLPLLVSVKYKDGWKFVDYFPTSGNTNARDLIMNLDLSEFRNSDQLQVRLQTTYMFWDLDYVGMDFSEKDSFQTAFIPAGRKYIKNPGGEMTEAKTGDHSLVKINGGEQLDLEFTINSSPGDGMKNSYFLVGNGYYHDNSRFEGRPRYSELNRFSGKGAFDKYSREKFLNLLEILRDNEKDVTISVK